MNNNKLFLRLIVAFLITVWFSTQEINGSSIHHPEFIWKHQPPADATNMKIDYLCLKRTKNGSQSLSSGSTDIKIKADTVYFPFFKSLYTLKYAPYEYHYDYGEVENWIAGIVKGDELIFKNMEVQSIIIDTIGAYELYPEEMIEYVDTTNVYYRAIKKFNSPHSYSNTFGEGNKHGSSVSFICSQEDVIGNCDLDKGLFHNFNASLCIAPKNVSSIGYESVTYGGTKYWPVPGCIIDEFITGKISLNPPASLQTPQISYNINSSYGHSMGGFDWITYNAELDFKMPIVNSDHTLIDTSKLFIKLFKNGEIIKDLPFKVYGDPFSSANYFSYTYATWSVNVYSDGTPRDDTDRNPLEVDVIEALVYYKNPDGTTIESPKARLDYPGNGNSITDIPATEPIYDGKTFDLTGREVNPDALSPGIYIRNGRKFFVGR